MYNTVYIYADPDLSERLAMNLMLILSNNIYFCTWNASESIAFFSHAAPHYETLTYIDSIAQCVQ